MQNPRAAAAAAAAGITASGQATGSTLPPPPSSSISDRLARIASVRLSRRTLARPRPPSFYFIFSRFFFFRFTLAPLLIVVVFRQRFRKPCSSLRHPIVYYQPIRRYAITINGISGVYSTTGRPRVVVVLSAFNSMSLSKESPSSLSSPLF